MKQQYWVLVLVEVLFHYQIIEFDRCNATDYKTYNIPVSKEFTSFIEDEYKYKDAGRGSFTDICALCRDICGVNLSVGYYNQHSPKERLIDKEWQHTLDLSRELLSKHQHKFLLTTNNEYAELIIQGKQFKKAQDSFLGFFHN